MLVTDSGHTGKARVATSAHVSLIYSIKVHRPIYFPPPDIPPYFKLDFVPEMPYIAFSHLAMAAYDSLDSESDSVEVEDPISAESDFLEADQQTSDESSGDEDATFVDVPDDEDVEVIGALVPCPPPPPQRSSSYDDEDEDVVCLYG